jgi:creatinine amidohydrolase
MVSFWKNLSRIDMAAIDKDRAVVMLPVSAIEQHGPHLPVGTDTIILDKLLEQFAAEKSFDGFDVVIAPQLTVGKSNEHMDFSGTLTLTAHTMYDVITEICRCIVQHGFKKIILTNSHGGNTDLLNLLSRDLRIALGAEIYVFDWWFTPFWKDIMDKYKGSGSIYGVFHACELETSLMLAYAPETVKIDRIADEVPDEMFAGNKYVTLYGPVNMGWKTADVSKNGVIGQPRCASAEKGRIFAKYAVDKLADIVAEVLRFHYI